jgi:hypothetical protein
MSDLERLQRFLRTDPREVGCDEAMAVLHISVDLVAAGQDVAGCYPGTPHTGRRAVRAVRTSPGLGDVTCCSVATLDLRRRLSQVGLEVLERHVYRELHRPDIMGSVGK